MKKGIIILSVVASIIVGACSAVAIKESTKNEKEAALIDLTKKLVTDLHYNNQELNDEFSKLEIDADAIVHLASANDILSKNTLKGIELSSIGTINTLKLAHNNGIEKFIFYSTLQVYGSELEGNYNEETQLKPENDYAMNHLFGEMYAEMFSRKTKIKIVVELLIRIILIG